MMIQSALDKELAEKKRAIDQYTADGISLNKKLIRAYTLDKIKAIEGKHFDFDAAREHQYAAVD